MRASLFESIGGRADGVEARGIRDAGLREMNARKNSLKRAGVLMALMVCGGSVVSGEAFRTGNFIQSWLLLGPVPVTMPGAGDGLSNSGTLLERDFLVQHGGEINLSPRAGLVLQSEGREYLWRWSTGTKDVVEFGGEEGEFEPSVAYAWTEIVTAGPTNVLMTVGGRGALKVWLNGAVMMARESPRSLRRDDEIFGVSLRGGTNRVLLKFQTDTSDCSFVSRFLGEAGAAALLVDAAGRGDLPTVRTLLMRRVDVNSSGPSGLTPLWAARIHGYEELAAYLESKGADSSDVLPPAGRVIDGMMQGVVVGASPGAVVMVSRYGKVVFENAYGYASLEHKVPVTPRTVFGVEALTEPFTSTAILMVRDQEKLKVTDPLSRFLPDFPWGEEITIHHLLAHTSGLHNYSDRGSAELSVSRLEPKEFISSIGRAPLDFGPGESWRIGDSDYLVLRYLLERISGVTYGQFLRSGIFGPLGMTNSAVYDLSAVVDHEASGYAYKGGGFKKALSRGSNWPGGGVLRSTARDLHVWTQALFRGEFLKKNTLKAALTPVRLSDGKKPLNSPDYGYGWVVTQLRGVDLVESRGSSEGFQSQVSYYPEHDLTVIVLINVAPAPPGLDAAALALEIGQLFLYDQMEARKLPGS